ncbi:MAG TPA: undecaprenyldiphospho-muramoylpentapeptide beta-N-acetylglucosaminyltransferase [Frankiaceae bacterium]|nr:undecaprenyldiphospho-muramoylpentapeptide beta-N-acetylglucosaminyltransferase [Frankiaceae bacterium]
MPRSVVIAGGGSAGHVEPALAVADALRAAKPAMVITLLGTEEGLETRLVPARGYPLRVIPRVPLPRRLTPSLLTVPFRAAGAVRAARRVLDEVDADVLVGVGGYVAFPAYLAARWRRCGIVVHEANPLPGIANRVGARLTRHVAISVPGTSLPHAVLTGTPLRTSLLALDRAGGRLAAREAFGLDPGRPTLLVFGGSQGARRINAAAVAAARHLTDAGIQVLHAAGAAGAADVRAALPGELEAPYVVLPYIDDMPAAYSAADVALCRSGAMTCAELSAVGLPAIFVPLPIGNGEQRINAEHAVLAGLAEMVADDELTGAWVQTRVPALFAEPGRLERMSAAAVTSRHRDAGAALVAMVADAHREAAHRKAGGRERPDS